MLFDVANEMVLEAALNGQADAIVRKTSGTFARRSGWASPLQRQARSSGDSTHDADTTLRNTRCNFRSRSRRRRLVLPWRGFDRSQHLLTVEI
jgi:hypothetical protein